jgi:hypothetical protein
MRLVLIVFVLTGCSVFHDARNELGRDLTGLQTELARLFGKEKSQ